MLSLIAAVLTTIKCAIGAGSFSLPRAFQDGGFYASVIFTSGLGILCGYTSLLLIESTTIASAIVNSEGCESKNISDHASSTEANTSRLKCRCALDRMLLPYELLNNRHILLGDHFTMKRNRHLTYPDIGEIAFPDAVVIIRGRKFNAMHALVTISIILTSIGVCAAYVDLITATIPDVAIGWYGQRAHWLTQKVAVCFLLPIILSLSYLRTMKLLSWTSAVGNFAVVTGCVVVLIYGFIVYSKSVTLNHSLIEPRTLPRYVGSTSFLFAIQIAILPVMQQMGTVQTNDLAKQQRKAIIASYSFVTLFNVAFGAIGYILFARSTCPATVTGHNAAVGPCDNVLSNIHSGGILDAVKLLICIDLLFTVPVILTASREIIEHTVITTLASSPQRLRLQVPVDDEVAGASVRTEATMSPLRSNGNPSGITKKERADAKAISTVVAMGDHQEEETKDRDGHCKYRINSNNHEEYEEESVHPENFLALGRFVPVSLEEDGDEDQDDDGRHRGRDEVTANQNNGSSNSSNAPDEIDSVEALHRGHGNRGGYREVQIDATDHHRTHTHGHTGTRTDTWKMLCVRICVRTIIVFVVVLIAVAVPRFGDVVNLVGGLVCSLTGYVLPPALFLRLKYMEGAIKNRSLHTVDTRFNDNRADGTADGSMNDEFHSLELGTAGVDSGEISVPRREEPFGVLFLLGHLCIILFGFVAMILSTTYTLASMTNQ